MEPVLGETRNGYEEQLVQLGRWWYDGGQRGHMREWEVGRRAISGTDGLLDCESV